MFGGKIMDTFMDKIAGKFGASDMIKANSEADARQLEAYKSRVEELEKAVSDMRRLSLKCVETNEATGQLVAGAIEKIEEVRTDAGSINPDDLKKITDELEALMASIEKSFKEASEENHKENVRVYRNVQASLIDELKQQSEAIAMQHVHIEKKMRGVKPIAIIALVFTGINLALWIAAIAYVLVNIF